MTLNSEEACSSPDSFDSSSSITFLTASGIFAIPATINSEAQVIPFGIPGPGQTIPVPADYYGTGQADIAVYLAASGVWAIEDPTGKTSGLVIPFGAAGVGNSIPVPGDYDGSGHVELAVYVPGQGAFYYRSDKGAGDVRVAIGSPNSGDIPAPGDYDGSGHDEVAIYSPTGGYIQYLPANGGPAVTIMVGTAGDGSIPVATPPGDLPQFASRTLPPGSAGKAIVPASTPSASTTTASTGAITLSARSAVPGGPTLASIRVARALVNQAATDPDDPA